MRVPSPTVLALAGVLFAGCRGDEAVRTPRPDAPAADAAPLPAAGPVREVLRLAPAPEGGLALTSVVPTPEARALVLAEVRRRWPGQALRADLTVEAGTPGSWVPEALALLPYVAAVEGGGLVVEAEAGAAGGGTLTLTGRVPDEPALARIAEDAAASIAPPFVVRTPLLVGLAADTTGAADPAGPAAPVVDAGPGTGEAAAALRAALADGALAFDPGAATLTAASSPTLARAAAALTDAPGVRVEVGAPGGSSGSASLDRALGARRAAALRDALVGAGLDADRVTVDEAADAPPAVVFRLYTID